MPTRMGSVDSAGSALVVAAKLVVPSVRPETVVRERLVARLDEASERPLTVVCAAAGYGKTTAVATWLATIDDEYAWISLGVLDNDPQRLCAHLLAAIETALPGAMGDAQHALSGGSDLQERVIPLMVGALAERADRRLVVVLDDYHLIENQSCHALVMALIDASPPAVRVIVCSRTLPQFRIARRRVLGTVANLGLRELAFQGGESARLLNGSLGLGLDSGVVEAIESRVEGWPAGLALVASSLSERSNHACYLHALAERHPDVSGTEVAAYLIGEVLDRTDPRLREFLRSTSILGRLSGPLCAAVLEDPAAHELLAEAQRSNLFVTVLDEPADGAWLRYHPLFAELLECELRAGAPELVPILHGRAAAWFAANGLAEEAIAHAIAAGDGERAAALLYDCWGKLFAQRRFVTVRRMIAQLPPDRGELTGFCEMLDTLCMGHDGADLRLIARRLDALEPLRDAPGVAPLIDQMRISPFYGDVGRAVRDGWAAWERYPDLPTRAGLAGQFGLVLWFAGERERARDIVEPLVDEIEVATLRSWALATLALTEADDGDLDLAERYGREAVAATAAPGDDALEGHFAHVALAEALRRQGALDESGEQLAHATRLTSRLPVSLYHAFTLVFDAQLHLARRDYATARARAAGARAITDRYPDVGTLTDRLGGVETATRRRNGDDLRGSDPTPAELRVLALLPSGKTVKEIAAELYVSVHTVSSHRRRLYHRLGATSREHAIATARERGLL
jgi:LuxR family transcriptional regulator, maltose regulon positive regulatory protein